MLLDWCSYQTKPVVYWFCQQKYCDGRLKTNDYPQYRYWKLIIKLIKFLI